jgi:hypothetical protein
MRTALAWIGILAAILASAMASGEAVPLAVQVDLPPGEQASWPLEATSGDAVSLAWQANGTLDLFVVQGSNDPFDGNASLLLQALDSSSGRAHVTLAGDGPWWLVVDNTASPAGGAPGTSGIAVSASVQPDASSQATGTDPASGTGGTPSQPGEAPTLWNTLMFDAPAWVPWGLVGFGSVALWMLILLVPASLRFASPLEILARLAGGAALFTLAWSLLPHPGMMTQVGLPLVAGLALAWFAVRSTTAAQDAGRLAFVAALLGAFAGVIVAYGLRHLWADPGLLVLGSERFQDVLFTLPAFALLGVLVFKVVPDVVHALEEAMADEPSTTQPGAAAQGAVFQVTCLRCHTEITVDRSMKRFRVATDRYEFACPNCQYWMEWADPRAQGAAAA